VGTARQPDTREKELLALHRVVDAALRADSLDALYATALEAVAEAIGVDRASILLLDDEGSMRFKAWIGLSEAYRMAVDGHSPWSPATVNPQPIVINEATTDPGTSSFREALAGERIQSLAFIPLLHQDRLIGKFMLYSGEPGRFGAEEVRLATTLGGTVALAIVKKRQEEEILDRRTRLDALFKALPVMIYEAEAGTPFGATWISENVLELTGFPSAPFTSEAGFWANHIHPDDRPGVEQVFSLARRGRPIEMEYRWRVANGDYRWFLERSYPVKVLPNGRLRLVGVWMDVTARVEAEEARRLSEARFAQAFHGSPDAININRYSDGTYLDVNEGFEEATGWTREEALGRTSLELGIWANPEERQRMLGRIKETGESRNQEFTFRRKDGSTRFGLMSARIQEINGEEVVLSITRDLTEQTRALLALRESEERYRTNAEAVPVTLYEFENSPAGWRFSYVSEKIEHLVGVPAAEVVKNPESLFRLIHPEDREEVFARIDEVLRTLRRFEAEFRILQDDGQVRWFRAESVARHGDPQNSVWSGYFMDITDRRNGEEALRRSEESYRGLFDCVRDAIYIQDEEGRFLDVNRGAADMYGYAREELIGQTPEMVTAPGLNDLPRVGEMVRLAFAGQPQQFEFWGLRKNGQAFPKDVRLYPGTYHGKQIVIALAQDITERRKAEEALRQSQKLESLGLLAGGIAHDFNNLLTAIVGNLDLACWNLPEESPARAYLDNAGTTVEKASDLTKQLLAYSGRGRFLVKAQDLNAVVQEMVQLLKVSISKRADLHLDLEPGLPAVEADLAQLQQVVMNLVTNASEALEGKDGFIRISTRSVDLDENAIQAEFPSQDLVPGRFVMLEVEDTGCGMNPEVQSRIFDPFFTTKDSGRGLGLSAMHGILRGHRGGIAIRSKVGKGSSLRVHFPASTLELPCLPPKSPATVHAFKGRALLVDDEEIILQSSGSMLEALGFEVLLARDGLEALERFQAEEPPPRLVLMDLTMPRMDGRTAFLEIQKLRPEVPVILSSGYDQAELKEGFNGVSPAGFIQKPYRLEELKALLLDVCTTETGA
jgi:PAS domain S-box-containing protein